MSSAPFSLSCPVVPFSVMPGDSFLCHAFSSLVKFECAERFLSHCLVERLLHTVMSGESLTLPCRVNPSYFHVERAELSLSHCHAERIPLTFMPSAPFSLSYLSNVTPLSYMGITPLCHVERAERVETSAQRVRNPACFTNFQLLCIFSIRILLSAADD